jgi:hypothetical protein
MDLYNKHENQQGVGLTYDLWKNFPTHEIFALKDQNVGFGCMMDPANPPFVPVATTTVVNCGGGWTGYADSAEYIRGTLHTEYGDGPALRFFTTTDNQECWIKGGGGGDPFMISDTAADAKELVFECSFRVANITTAKYGFFVGLAQGLLATNMIADAGTLADTGLIGLFKPEGDTTTVDLVYQKASGGVITHKDAWKTIAALTWYHFGLRYNPNTKTLTPYWGTGDRSTTKMAADTDNAILSTDIDDATFPDGIGMSPLCGMKAAHADDAYVDVRTLACAQRAWPAS